MRKLKGHGKKGNVKARVLAKKRSACQKQVCLVQDDNLLEEQKGAASKFFPPPPPNHHEGPILELSLLCQGCGSSGPQGCDSPTHP